MKQKTGKKTYNYPEHTIITTRVTKNFKNQYFQYCSDRTFDVSKRLKWLMILDMEGKLKEFETK